MKLNALLFVGFTMTGLFSAPALADDNIAACEIVFMRPIIDPSQNPMDEPMPADTPMVAQFLPAGEFIFSVFDETTAVLTEIDGQKIQAVMCTRSSVMPTEFDLKMIRTGIPLHLSQNFDSPDSSLLSIRKQDGVYTHTYNGPELSAEDLEVLKLRLEKLNEPVTEVDKETVVENELAKEAAEKNVEENVEENANR